MKTYEVKITGTIKLAYRQEYQADSFMKAMERAQRIAIDMGCVIDELIKSISVVCLDV